ncbi:MAG: hexose kinase [Candidatus Omnitrophica bacterium]|nr:hexose kinase [Candidatus Omnitrophota bacterium]
MKTNRILTVTLNPALDRIVRSGKTTIFPGGKGVNVSRALKALGLVSMPLIAIAGTSGRRLSGQLRDEGLPPVLFILRGKTRTNTTTIHRNGMVTRIFESGPVWAREDVMRFKKFFASQILGARIVIFSGSLPVGVPSSFYRSLIGVAKRAGAQTFLDTSADALGEGIKAKPFLIKPNQEEAEAFLKCRLSSQRLVKKGLRSFLKRGMKMVLLTLGEAGLVITQGEEFLWARGPKVKGHTVGCGDAALAGCVAGMMAQDRLEDQIRLAAACGAEAARSIKPGAISKKGVQRMAGRVRVKQF